MGIETLAFNTIPMLQYECDGPQEMDLCSISKDLLTPDNMNEQRMLNGNAMNDECDDGSDASDDV